jgi:hypothetical protein
MPLPVRTFPHLISARHWFELPSKTTLPDGAKRHDWVLLRGVHSLSVTAEPADVPSALRQ